MRNYETKVYDYIDKKTGAHIVKARTMYAGKTVSAIAKCDPTDTFDFEFGKRVALLRLDAKIAHKRYVSMRTYADFCKTNLGWIETERRRTKKALERAQVAAADRKAEAKEYEAELAKLLGELA